MPGQGQRQVSPNTTWRVAYPSTWTGQSKRQVPSLGGAGLGDTLGSPAKT